jgi:DNA-binding winged helix-turn-helix (wHTH) protein
VRTRFGSFILDTGTRQLVDGERQVHLSPKAFDVLRVLVEERPKVVNKTDLHDRIWPGTFVVDANLSVLVAEVRRALGDSAQEPRFIRTVHRVGYAFCGQASDVAATDLTSDTGAARCWLAWNDRTFVLAVGESIIGRDPACVIWLDASGVSRRHARVRLDGPGGAVTLEDLGSTNGTFVGETPVSAPTPLDDGALVHIGSVTLTFRAWSPERPRATERITRG